MRRREAVTEADIGKWVWWYDEGYRFAKLVSLGKRAKINHPTLGNKYVDLEALERMPWPYDPKTGKFTDAAVSAPKVLVAEGTRKSDVRSLPRLRRKTPPKPGHL